MIFVTSARSTIAATLRRLRRVAPVMPALLAACSSADLVNALVPHSGYSIIGDQPYGALPRQALDIYRPVEGSKPYPVVIFVYGGNWQFGAKADYRFVGQALASRGFMTVIADYRLYPEIKYPDFLRDEAKAVTWVFDHLDTIGGDPSRVFLMGHSAGAYIAAMLALDPEWLGLGRQRLHGVIGLAGPYDFLPLTDPALQDMFGTEPDLWRTQPIAYVDGTNPPLLLIAGLDDKTVYPSNSMRLAARIRDKGGSVEERYYPGVGHVPLVGALAAPAHFLAPTLGDVMTFLKQ